MKHLTFYDGSINTRHIDDAVRILRDGGVIIYPTGTLYALGCDVLNVRAVERLCRLKGIDPARQLLSVVCASLSQAAEYTRIDNRAFRMLREYLPGPFTFILPASGSLPRVFRGRKSVGVRIPDCGVATSLAEALGNPLLSTSVGIDPDDPESACLPECLGLRYQHDADLLIDAGEGTLDLTTIIDCLDSSSPELVRQGAGQFID